MNAPNAPVASHRSGRFKLNQHLAAPPAARLAAGMMAMQNSNCMIRALAKLRVSASIARVNESANQMFSGHHTQNHKAGQPGKTQLGPPAFDRPLTTLIFLLLIFLAVCAQPAHAARVALVIGNAGYDDRPLKNPVNDAQDLATALIGAGFKVTFKQNLNADGMKEAISEFGDALRRENDVGLFFFSGHGYKPPRATTCCR
jgi:hypothetical protein